MAAGGGCASLRAQLEDARLGLQRLEKDIRRAAQRSTVHRGIGDRNFQNSNNRTPRLGKNNFYQDGLNQKNNSDERFNKKRPQETKTVFSRLSARLTADSDGEEETTTFKKPRLSSQVIRDLPTKQEVLKAQEGDEQSKARNRRMFGSLLGTLQKFKQESIILQNKEDKKAQVEKKIEEQEKQEKENQKKERQNLFASREIKKATIKALEAKMVRMREFEKWELAHTMMLGFIQTKGKPQIFWRPKKMSEPAQEKLNVSKAQLEKMMEKKREDVAAELNAIEQRCLRNIRLPPGSHLRPKSLTDNVNLSTSNDNLMDVDLNDDDNNSSDERVTTGSMVIKLDKDKNRTVSENDISMQAEVYDDLENNFENGKSQQNEKWNRDDRDSSSDENDDHNDEVEKDHSMREATHAVDENIDEEPGGRNSEEYPDENKWENEKATNKDVDVDKS